jgi:hypothetical protein
MPTPPLTVATLRETYALVMQHGGSVTAAALAEGVPYGTLAHRWRLAKAQHALDAATGVEKDFEIAPLPDERPTAADLLTRRAQQFARKHAAVEARRLIPVTVRVDGPIGIAHVGDPHVDDDGTDIAKLQAHVALCNRTEALFAACVGDYQNNWVGRLARLYSEQSTSAREAWVLVEWLIGATDWLYLVGGNHDAWSGAGDPLEWIAKQRGQTYERNGARLGLQLPTGRTIRVNARHEFPGTSQWNTAHGPAKAVQMGARDHIVTCGHQHTSGYQVLKDPATGLISHALRVASYKTHDRYADERGLRDQAIFVCPVTIIDPAYGDDDPRCITTVFDPAEGADYLTWKRKRWARKQAS